MSLYHHFINIMHNSSMFQTLNVIFRMYNQYGVAMCVKKMSHQL